MKLTEINKIIREEKKVTNTVAISIRKDLEKLVYLDIRDYNKDQIIHFVKKY